MLVKEDPMPLNRFLTRWLLLRHRFGWGQLAPYCKRAALALLVFCLLSTFLDMLIIGSIGEALQTHGGMRLGYSLVLLSFYLVGEVLLTVGGIVQLRQAAQ